MKMPRYNELRAASRAPAREEPGGQALPFTVIVHKGFDDPLPAYIASHGDFASAFYDAQHMQCGKSRAVIEVRDHDYVYTLDMYSAQYRPITGA